MYWRLLRQLRRDNQLEGEIVQGENNPGVQVARKKTILVILNPNAKPDA